MKTPDSQFDLPVRSTLPTLLTTLKKYGMAVLIATPGAGKTTLVPPAIMESKSTTGGKILLLEPRRIAARATAGRIALLLGEPVGKRVGYAVRGDNKYCQYTKILAITGGVMLRMIQEDPFLEGVDTVIFDEFHERSLESDLNLALVLDLRKNLRTDLNLLIMSATLDAQAVSELLGGAPIIHAPGRRFPVELRWSNTPLDRLHPAPAVARACLKLFREKSGDMLVFLPGMNEIQEVATRLNGALDSSALILPLHGSLSIAEQNAALATPPVGKRKIVLATNIAESSLTIDGITLVVDTGLERRMRFYPAAGMSFLETCRISQASATQRSGRAGRTAPGTALRLWTELEHHQLSPHNTPEILDAELTSLALELANWGASPEQLSWLDPPPVASFATARQLLNKLGAMDESGNLTPHGKQLVKLPVHPRIGTMLLEAVPQNNISLATEIAALLTERDTGRNFDGADLGERIRRMRSHPAEFRNQLAIQRQLLALMKTPYQEQDLDQAGTLIAYAFPEWIGRARSRHSRSYLLSNGTAAQLTENDPLRRCEFLTVARLAAHAGGNNYIELAMPLERTELDKSFSARYQQSTITEFDPDQERLVTRRETRLGALLLESTPIAPPPGASALAIINAAIAHKLELPPIEQKNAVGLLKKARFATRMDKEHYPDWSPENWSAILKTRVPPLLGEIHSFSDLCQADWYSIMQNLLGTHQLHQLNLDYPDFYTTPAGISHRIDYDQEQPTLAVRIQELYGMKVHPSTGRTGFPLRLELLSPAGRPVQITTDLPRFWTGNWKLVQKEMKGRYPKHSWPDDPINASPTTRAKPKT